MDQILVEDNMVDQNCISQNYEAGNHRTFQEML